jgi:hypothetical protein
MSTGTEDIKCPYCGYGGAEVTYSNKGDAAEYKGVEYSTYYNCAICGWEKFEEPNEEALDRGKGDVSKPPSAKVIPEAKKIIAFIKKIHSKKRTETFWDIFSEFLMEWAPRPANTFSFNRFQKEWIMKVFSF